MNFLIQVEKVMHAFMALMNNNCKFFTDTFFHQQFVLKLAAQEETIQKFFAQNPETINWVINFINESELPNLNSNSLVQSHKNKGFI